MKIGVETSCIQKKLRTNLALNIGVKFSKLTNPFYKVAAHMFTQVEQSTKVIFLIPNLLEKADK
jgi:transcription initiation factor TFIIIB Brf1 subunit/transcription initiation factor TFIIB